MAKKKIESVIALEIEKYEKKIAEFQTYLESHKVDNAEEKYKEMDAQTKLMNALPNWILALKQMKEDVQAKQNQTELRGGAQISGMAKLMMEKE